MSKRKEPVETDPDFPDEKGYMKESVLGKAKQELRASFDNAPIEEIMETRNRYEDWKKAGIFHPSDHMSTILYESIMEITSELLKKLD